MHIIASGDSRAPALNFHMFMDELICCGVHVMNGNARNCYPLPELECMMIRW